MKYYTAILDDENFITNEEDLLAQFKDDPITYIAGPSATLRARIEQS